MLLNRFKHGVHRGTEDTEKGENAITIIVACFRTMTQ